MSLNRPLLRSFHHRVECTSVTPRHQAAVDPRQRWLLAKQGRLYGACSLSLRGSVASAVQCSPATCGALFEFPPAGTRHLLMSG